MMTKKHFKAIAAALKEVKPADKQDSLERWEIVVYRMSELCQKENPLFHPARFLAACGYQQE